MDRVATIPNLLTLARILLIAPIITLASLGYYESAAILFVLGAATDGMDGHIARRYDQESKLGAILDPIADKLYVLAIIPFLWIDGIIPLWFTLLICTRYLAQLTTIPVLVFWLKIPFHVKPKFLPKVATTLAFILMGAGLLLKATTPESNTETVLEIMLLLLVAGLAALEAYVLVTFIPRYYQIIRKTHDTFE